VRRSDYKIWNNGRFYFSIDEYRSFIARAQEVFGPGCHFIIGSEERLAPDAFRDLDCSWCTGVVGAGHYVESMVELSLCDMIMSPPSTFSAWAAFLGEIHYFR
jgi:hypothetical protein